ncbi:MAG: VIT domain-containing protein, partial [Ignavibacteriaceae bacterium]|nr:VIT domain-containing protein [Ignavibacteriaceae bacterium]
MKRLTFLLALLIISQTLAINELVVKVPNVYTSKPGYIDQATLVIQPYGGYAEQSLYLEYSDHNQFTAGQQVEIIHRFELPQGSTVNDLWLWIGDNVMKAIVIDTWKARKIYDSIVSMKRDPAFLTKSGNQYELHIYPLTPGSIRKIKMNFITPTQSILGEILAELPLGMLNSSNNTIQPLTILYRTTQDIWGVPHLKEFPSAVFTDVTDTLGYHYRQYKVANIKTLSTFRFAYNFSMSQSAYFSSSENDSSQRYFQLMVSAKDALGIAVDSSAKKVMFGLDLSG